MVRKIKVGIFKFTSCSGCQIEILAHVKKFFELSKKIDLKYMKILRKGKIEDFDIGFIEGSISQNWEIEQLRDIRKKTKYLIALGSCAVVGGISSLQNYLQKGIKLPKKAYPIEKYIEVDYNLRGCPINGEEFVEVINFLIVGKTLKDREIPVCNECKKNNNLCLIKQNKFCAGPITYSGCRAICPENNYSCIGCRGITKDANLKEWIKRMQELGFKNEVKEVLKTFKYEP